MTFKVAGLYAIADTRCLNAARLLPAVRSAIDAGARVIQYRDKSDDRERRAREARALADCCRERGVLFLINDDVDLAADVNADGVHLGREDASLAQARARLGTNAVIGVSCYNELAWALEAIAAGADYAAFGSFFASRTKPDAVRADTALLRAARTKIAKPIVAIGGITPANGGELLAAGADALAVIDGVFGQPDVSAAAAAYVALFR